MLCDTSKKHLRVNTSCVQVHVGTCVCKTICVCKCVYPHACVAKQPPMPQKQHACDMKTTRVGLKVNCNGKFPPVFIR